MPLPKRKHSKSRRDKRRTHDKIVLPLINKCPKCGEAKISHRVCLNCGYYNNRLVINIKEVKKEKK